jgi:hypothetical protein
MTGVLRPGTRAFKVDLVAAGFHQSQSNGLSSDFANGLCGYYLSKNNVVYYINIGNLIS